VVHREPEVLEVVVQAAVVEIELQQRRRVVIRERCPRLYQNRGRDRGRTNPWLQSQSLLLE
jgi:hypothetical protein